MRFDISHRLNSDTQINFIGQFRPGERVALLGVSGAGKTTLLRYLAGLNHAGKCHVEINDTALKNAWHSQVTLLHQHPVMFAHHRVQQTIDYGNKYNPNVSLPIDKWIRQLGVESLLNQRCSELSGGQAQRVALLRALNTGRQWLLLDEAFSALDASKVVSACQVIAEYCQLTGAGVVVASHQDSPQRFLCESAYVVEDLTGTYHQNLFTVLDQQLEMQITSTLNVSVLKTERGFLQTELEGQHLFLAIPQQWQQGPARVSIAAGDIAIAIGEEHLTSMVNRLKGEVLSTIMEDQDRVTLRLGIGTQCLSVDISQWSFQRLDIRVGITVFAEFKVGAVQWHGQAFTI